MNKKRMRKTGVSIRIHPAGIAALVGAAVFLDSRQVFASFLALALHEGAHLVVMRLCGINDCVIEITPFGGMVDAFSFDRQSAGKRMLCACAGVVGSAIVAVACFLYAPRLLFWQMFFRANCMLAVFNALPAWPLDGARAIAACTSKAGWEAKARKVLSYVTLLLGTGMIALGLYGIWHGIFHFSLLIMGPYLWYAARLEDISAKVRRLHRRYDQTIPTTAMPAKLWVGSSDSIERDFNVLLGRIQPEQYHLLIQIDSQSGKIHRLWTENEMWTYVLEDCQK